MISSTKIKLICEVNTILVEENKKIVSYKFLKVSTGKFIINVFPHIMLVMYTMISGRRC